MIMVEQIPTGISGLDKLIAGGLPKHRTVLVSGPAGAAKTTFGLQFIYHGIVEEGETGIYITFDDRPANVRMDCANFGWDLAALEEQGLLILVDGFSGRAGVHSDEEYQTPTDVDELLTKLITWIDQIGAERVVIDSITALALSLPDETARRREILKLSGVLASLDTTTIMTSEMGDSGKISRFGFEGYMTQSSLVLRYEVINNASVRSISIRKMRGVKHAMTTHPFNLTPTGIVVYDSERYLG